jgi:hypothetical protein
MARGFRITVFSLLLMSSTAFVHGEESKAAASKSWDDFKIISERNIFSRNRTKSIALTETQRPVIVIPEQRYHTLRGITKQPDGYVSFIEDSRTSNVAKHRKGDSVAGGKITDITLDDISYKKGGKTLKIEIGMNLEGQTSAVSMQNASVPGGPMNNSGFAATGQQGPGGMQQMSGGIGQQGQGGMQQMSGGMGQQGPGAMGQQGQNSGMGDQLQGRGGQGPGANQAQAAGQPGGAGQSSAATNLSQSADQTQTTAQAAKTGQTSESSDEIIQRLKEKRKKELEQ